MRCHALASFLLLAAFVFPGCSDDSKPPPSVSPGFGGSAGTTSDASAGGMGGSAGESGGAAGSNGGAAGAAAGAAGSGGSLADGAACQVDPTTSASQGTCVATFADGYECNPVSNEGCEAGQVCEYFKDRFACFPTATTQPACGECYAEGQAYCGPGFTCHGATNICTRFCCDNTDCAAGTSCVPQPPTTLGICQAVDGSRFAAFAFASDGGQGGSAGQGGDAGQDAAAGGGQGGSAGIDGGGLGEGEISCVANTPAPSNGSCYTGPGCNPISQSGCKSNEACEYDGDSFECATRTASQGPCTVCVSFGACSAGYTCDPSESCARVCCDDADCDAKSECVPLNQAVLGAIGLCRNK